MIHGNTIPLKGHFYEVMNQKPCQTPKTELSATTVNSLELLMITAKFTWLSSEPSPPKINTKIINKK